MPQTTFAGPKINYGTPRPATIAFKLSNEGEWILGVQDGNYLKMVKLRVTGSNSYEWIDTKYEMNGKYDASCLISFSESCFVGTSVDRDFYRINLVTELGKHYRNILLNV